MIVVIGKHLLVPTWDQQRYPKIIFVLSDPYLETGIISSYACIHIFEDENNPIKSKNLGDITVGTHIHIIFLFLLTLILLQKNDIRYAN